MRLLVGLLLAVHGVPRRPSRAEQFLAANQGEWKADESLLRLNELGRHHVVEGRVWIKANRRLQNMLNGRAEDAA